MDDKPHYAGHRKRLRERFRKHGYDGLQDYEVLELMLTYALPRKDVKPLAKELLSRFGGFKGVLDAPFDDLSTVRGLSENAATFLTALKGATSLYLKEQLHRQRTVVSSPEALLSYCRAAMGGLKDEQFRAMFLNSRNEIIVDEVLHEGTVNQSAVYPRKVMERALKHNATALIFVHNHPSGACRPSADDKAITAELVRIARGLNMTVHDHLIICRDGHFSFLEQGLL